MTPIAQAFDRLRRTGRKGLIVYITAGCPDYGAAGQAVLAAVEAGADIVEIGLPFSDPMADGPVLQKAAAMALAAGAAAGKTRRFIDGVRAKSAVPLAAMAYVNTVQQYGIWKFAEDFAAAGVSGLIIPDLPLEECELARSACKHYRLDLIQFVAPTTGSERIGAICGKADGFLYCISSTGVTGVREVDYSLLDGVIGEVRRRSELPVAVGFGVGGPEAAVAAARRADAVIVGSAVMQRLMDQGPAAVGEFTRLLRRALDEGR